MKAPGSVGVRDLKANPTKYLRMVRDQNVELDVTVRGEVVARIVPAGRRVSQADIEAALERHRQLTKEISARWTGTPSAVDAVREQRREL